MNSYRWLTWLHYFEETFIFILNECMENLCIMSMHFQHKWLIIDFYFCFMNINSLTSFNISKFILCRVDFWLDNRSGG
jgi:hypothetical protein